MKLKLLVISLLVVLTAFGAGAWPRSASAAETQSLSVSQSCLPDGTLSVTFSWPDVDIFAVQQWLDLSLFDNGWQPGTFLGNGPLAAAQQQVTWNGLLQDTTHYVRVNEWLPGGDFWSASPTFYFTTGSCPSPLIVPPPINAPMQPAGYRVQVLAPIDSATVANGSQPGDWVVQVKAGLPGGCAKQDTTSVTRQGTTIMVQVFNTMPADKNVACTAIYGYYNASIDIGSLTPGTPYQIMVNDKVINFVIP